MVYKMEMKIKKKRLGRPKSKFQTEQKTYMFFSEDVDFVLDSGATPKEVYRLGCIAKRDNPQLMNRIKELEKGNDRLQKKLTRIYSSPEVANLLRHV